jgi:hypothetical protein
MSKIEETTKPILEQMIRGQTVVLDEHGQTSLATWINLKILIAEHHMKKDPITPLSDRSNFRINPMPVNNIKIWVSSCSDHRWQTSFLNSSIYLSTAPAVDDGSSNGADNSQSITFGMGRLFVHACHTTVEGVDFDLQIDNKAVVRQLWPIVDRPMFWPPLRDLSFDEASDMASSIERFLYAFHKRQS